MEAEGDSCFISEYQVWNGGYLAKELT